MPALAAERIIELADGSQIRGDVVSVSNDKFVIRTQSLGTVTLSASQVVDMRAPGTPAAGSPAAGTPAAGSPAAGKPQAADKSTRGSASLAGAASASGGVASLTAAMTSNPQLLGSIMSLQDDPRMKAILSDPALMKAVQNMDLDTLANDPRIKALMQSPAVKQIQSEVRQ